MLSPHLMRGSFATALISVACVGNTTKSASSADVPANQPSPPAQVSSATPPPCVPPDIATADMFAGDEKARCGGPPAQAPQITQQPADIRPN